MLANELKFFLRQPLVWLGAMFYLAFAGLVSFGVHNPDLVAVKQFHYKTMTVLMLGVPLLIGVLAPISFLREHACNMVELILATPQKAITHLKYRLFVLIGFIFSCGALGVMLCAWLISLQTSTSLLLFTFAMGWDLLLLYLPTIALFSCFSALLCYRFKSSPAVYAVFASMWAGYMVLASITGISIMAGSYIVNDTLLLMMVWFDPYGISSVFNQFRLGELSGQLNVSLIFNRLFYLVLAVMVFYWAAKVGLRPFPEKTERNAVLRKLALVKFDKTSGTKDTNENYTFSRTSSPLTSNLVAALKALFSNKLTQLILAGWFMLIFSEVAAGIKYVEPMSQLVPTSIDAWNRVAFDIIPILGNVLLLFWIWQICWRAKQVQISELVASTPISSFHLSLSNLLTATVTLFVILLTAAIATLFAEVWADSTITLSHYAKQLLLLALPLFISATIYVAINTICKNRVVAALLSLICIVLKFTPLMSLLGLSHPLWQVAGVPLLKPDALWGFSGSLSTFIPYMAFWLSISVALLFIAIAFSHRGTSLCSTSWSTLTKTKKLWIVASVSFIAIAINLMHQQLQKERPLMNRQAQHEWRAAYERQYQHWQNIAQPSVTDMKVIGEFYPDDGKATFDVELTLTNESNEMIHQVLVGGIHGYPLESLSLQHSQSVDSDNTLNQHIFELSAPLFPGQSLLLKTEMNYQQPKLWPATLHQIVTPEFTYFRSTPMIPNIGFNPDFMVNDNTRRLELGLTTLNDNKPTDYLEHRLEPSNKLVDAKYRRMQIHSIISTTKSHNVIAPGKLINQNTKGGRTTYEFRTRQPIRDIAAWFSLPYSSLSENVKGTELHVYAPELNVEKYKSAANINLQGMKDTVEWFTANISPYHGSRLNLIAMPDIGATGYAMPHNMLIGHSVGFRAIPKVDLRTTQNNKQDFNNLFDHRYRRAVHETAHQWFGHDIGNGVDWDRTFLIESMAKYVELVMLEKHKGKDAVNALINYEYKRYTNAVSNETSKPMALIDTTNAYDQYSRATLAFTLLRDEIGDQPIVNTLHALWQQHKYPKSPASSVDFIRLLKQYSEQKHHDFIEQLFLSEKVDYLLKHPRFQI